MDDGAASTVESHIRALQKLPRGAHWFCPRQYDGDTTNYANIGDPAEPATEEDRKSNVAKIEHVEEAKRRSHKAIQSLRVLTFETEDMAASAEWYKNQLDEQMTKCDECVKAYHQLKKKFLEDLRGEHDDEEVAYFARVLGDADIHRIRSGLLAAAETLRSVSPELRGISILEGPSLFAIFEALSSEAVLTDVDFMAKYLDEPFRLVQTNRLLKLNDYVPAMGRFLFDREQIRMLWAQKSWGKKGRCPTMEEFWWVVQDPLLHAARLAAHPAQDNAYLDRFWQGVNLIVMKLDRTLITNCLRALDVDIYRLALDHLPRDSPAYRSILQIFENLLVTSPSDFWDAMGAISPAAIVEGICSPPQFIRRISEATEGRPFDEQRILSWIDPFMVSLKPANQLPACRALIFYLMERYQVDGVPMDVRKHMFECGIRVLSGTLRKLLDEKSTVDGSVGQVVISEIMDEIAKKHIDTIVTVATVPTDNALSHPNVVKLSLEVIEHTLKLDCHCFKVVHDALEKGVTSQIRRSLNSQRIWNVVTGALKRNLGGLARSTLRGMIDQVGIEKFNAQEKTGHIKEKIEFNEAYGTLLKSISIVFERLSDFDPDVLATLFQKVDTAGPLIAGLFAADQSIYSAAVEVINIVGTQPGRRESLSYLLRSYFEPIMLASSWTIKRIAEGGSFYPQPRMLKTCGDILDILCDPRDGILVTKSLSDGEATAIQGFWQYVWNCLTVIFRTTETWGSTNERVMMKEFCRDTMQFAEKLFDQYSIFAGAIDGVTKSQNNGIKDDLIVNSGRILLRHPTRTLESMVKWLRLRDEFLAATLADLVCKVLRRLGEWGMTIGDSTLFYIEDISVRGVVKTILTPQERAQINRALDEHLKREPKAIPRPSKDLSASTKQSTLTDWQQSAATGTQGSQSRASKIGAKPIDLDYWRAKAMANSEVIEIPDDEDEIMAASRSVELLKAQQAARRPSTPTIRPSKAAAAKFAAKAAAVEAAQKSFREKREQEKREKAARDKEQIARLKQNAGVAGFDLKSKDPPVKASSMMVSSESELDEDDELDRELFGIDKPSKTSEAVRAYQESKMLALKQAPKGPVKKLRQIRNASDMRARLAPDLSPLHRTILSWDYFHNDIFPPNSDRNDYILVNNTFRSSSDYQATFQPLLILEAWQSFVKSREEGTSKAFEIKVVNRVTVDSFIEVSSSMTIEEGRDLGLGEADIILMSKGRVPTQEPNQLHCLARVAKIARKKTGMEITYKVNPNNPLLSSLNPNATLKGVKVDSITPLEREYGALLGLQYYDLCDEIIKAKPSPILNYSEKQLTPIKEIYKLNLAQTKALKSAVDNDAFTLIQGPPGSGKTKTIVAIVGALLSRTAIDRGVPISRPNGPSNPSGRPSSKKLLICAPSNAAVDELVMRLKEGVKTLNGELLKLSILRLGRSDAINANVLDVTLDELVTKRLNLDKGGAINYGEEIHKCVEESKSLSEAQNVTRAKLQEVRAKGESVVDLEREFELQKRKKAHIGMKLDSLRDKSSTVARDAEISRRRVQQEILDGAHVICATLSGSGHEMFHNLSIEFETVIIDEAAQSIELSALIPLKYGCSKCILVGDPKQLPPTVLSREAARFSYEQSLFVRMQANHPNDVHLLDTQYRMHPEISQYPSKAFYDGRLLDGENMANIRLKPWHQSTLLGPYRFFDVQGQHQSATKGHSLINVAELEVALQLYERLTTDYKGYDYKGKIGIITPYKGQLLELKIIFSRKYGESILKTVEFNTTDAFQGRENEIIIFSCVRASPSQGIGFLDDIRRMNVGLTRAKSSLWVLGNSQSLCRNEFWGKLIDDARQRDRYTNGNLMDLLRKPTIEQVSGSRDVEMTDAPDLNESSTATTLGPMSKRDSNVGTARAQKPHAPSGETWGLNNPKACCTLCGSPDHFHRFCENEAAMAASRQPCYRCGALDHQAYRCGAPLCTLCGEIGHTKPSCVSRNHLSRNQQATLVRKEARYESQKQNFVAKQKQIQLADHDPRIPVVQTTRKTPPLENQRGRMDAKRKREPSPLGGVGGMRVATGNSNSAPQGPARVANTGFSGPVPTGPANPSNGPRHPLPMRPHVAAPPLKKKPVDPFIRPNRKKPRP